jgi:hypothetical protein
VQSNSETPAAKKKISWLKLFLFSMIAFLIILPVTFYVMYGPALLHVLFPTAADRDFKAGIGLWYSDRPRAIALMEKGIRESAGDDRADRMWKYQKYAGRLYTSHDIEQADQQTQKGIDLCPTEPANATEASALAHLYQDRGWFHHLDFLEDRKLPDGVKDQEKAVAIVTKWFGPTHHETTSKTPTLAVMYVNTGQIERGNKLISSALQAVDTVPGADNKWLVLDCESRIKAAEHNYKGAVQSFIQAWKVGGEANQGRVWTDFVDGIEPGNYEEWKDKAKVAKLMLASNYAALDKIAENLTKSQAASPDGTWILDNFFTVVVGQNDLMSIRVSEADYTQRLYELKSWLKQTKSPTARVALANCLVHYSLFCQNYGRGDQTQSMMKVFMDQNLMAKKLLDSDSSVGKLCPRAFRVYSKLYANLGGDDSGYTKMVDHCHQLWPNYHTIDLGAATLLGSTGSDSWVAQRCNQVGGAKGDELFAQIITYLNQFGDYTFDQSTWPRVKAGYKQIFVDFPSSIEARRMYIYMCVKAGDLDATGTAFDGFKQ